MLELISIDGDPMTRKTRLVAALMQLWTFIDYFHPDTEHNVNWKAALIEAVSRVSEAVSHEQYEGIITAMLAHLRDPATHMVKSTDDSAKLYDFTNGSPLAERLADGIWVLRMQTASFVIQSKEQLIIELNSVAEQVIDCSKLIIDLRGIGLDSKCELVCEALEQSKLVHVLSNKLQISPPQTVRYYHGLPPTKGVNRGIYRKYRKTFKSKEFHPVEQSTAKEVIFLVNIYSHLPDIATALQFDGSAYIIGDGPLRGYTGNRAETLIIPGLGLIDVRLSELGVVTASQGGFRVNETISSDPNSDRAMQRAIAIAHADRPAGNPYPNAPVGNFRRTTARSSFPNSLERSLAAVRIWFVFSFFFPYRHLMDRDWNQILLDYLPIFDQCEDALSYVQAVARMTSHVQDSHVWVMSEKLNQFLRMPVEPFGCRLIEKKVVVTWIGKAADDAGLRIGDVIERVDGKDVFECMQQFKPYISASTPQHERLRLVETIFRGQAGSAICLQIRDGIFGKKILFCRQPGSAIRQSSDVGSGARIRILDGNIGYVDLTRLVATEVNDMFEELRWTEGIIFDMRGYPHRSAWVIAPRLVDRSKAYALKRGQVVQASIPAAIFKCPVNPPEKDTSFPAWRPFIQTIPWADSWRYDRRTVMLIDERTISQAEHTGLFFKAANGTTFIGSPTAGANGDITNFSLPGGIAVTLTGQSVEHPDGRQLQRVGLIPDVWVAPTIEGIRQGKDEVLERALEFMQQQG